ncbi:hypothetical protein EF912_27130 [Streptomyces sp. WAC07061]|nr:hypothetical protein EF912_27130 [Streptomyces sp. WAC07061]
MRGPRARRPSRRRAVPQDRGQPARRPGGEGRTAWVRCERAMRRGEDLPVSRFPVALSLGVGLVAAAMVVVVLLGWTAGR